MLTQNILTKPTFDLTDWKITNYISEDKIIFCQSNQVFQFDKCKGLLMPRSRILRFDKNESEFVKNVISATIDAGFCGKLVWKIELTNIGNQTLNEKEENIDWRKETRELVFARFQKQIQNSVQIDLNPFPNNYYEGTNQTGLEPDVIFNQI